MPPQNVANRRDLTPSSQKNLTGCRYLLPDPNSRQLSTPSSCRPPDLLQHTDNYRLCHPPHKPFSQTGSQSCSQTCTQTCSQTFSHFSMFMFSQARWRFLKSERAFLLDAHEGTLPLGRASFRLATQEFVISRVFAAAALSDTLEYGHFTV
eukprot:6173649-Pleurochrysis_carterae.AAC.1